VKESRYNRIFQASDGTWLAFNGMTTALAEIEPEQLGFIRSMLTDPERTPCDTEEKREIREALIEGGYLIGDTMDELATVKADLLRDRFSGDELHLTVAPTLECNFGCDYCYEERLRVTMSQPIADALRQWVADRCSTAHGLFVTWYGGEPLLPRAYEVIEMLSASFIELTEKAGMEYAACVVSNGYLLSRERMERLAELGVKRAQLTLDGPPEIHDQRRQTLGGKGTFWRIIRNLKECADLADFQLRINVDRRNAMSALEVIEILRSEGLEKRVRAYLAQVIVDGATCGNIAEACFSSEEFAKTELEIYREAARRGLPLLRYPMRIEGAYCTAERLNGHVIAPSGNIFKCWHEVTMNPDHATGSLIDDQQPFQRHNEDRWLGWDSFERSGCRSCDVLPLCHGGCPLEAMRRPDSDRGACEQYRYHLEPILELHHLNRDVSTAAQPCKGDWKQ
jgi:uncharacterized protein